MIELIKPLHHKELRKNLTKYGVAINTAILPKYFNPNAKESKLYIDYAMFDSYEDLYFTDYINENSI